MGIAFGILIIVVGNIIKRYDANNTDDIFWIGVGFSCFIILFIINKISKKTKEIKDL